MTNSDFEKRISALRSAHEELIGRKNPAADSNGVWTRYTYPILTAAHTPLFWRYDLNPATNPFLLERFGINGTFNSGAIKFDGKYVLVVRVEGNDRKSFFALAESDNGIDGFRFRDHPLTIPPIDESETNLYDMRLTAHEDGWIYGIFCAERHDPSAAPGDLSSAVATAGVARTKDLVHWERLPDIKSPTQQRNVVLHPEFVNGKYALYTRPQEGFIAAGALGGGIGWALVDDMTRAEIRDEKIIDVRFYHTIKEVKNGEDPHSAGVAAYGPRRTRLCGGAPLCTLHVYDGPRRSFATDRHAGRICTGTGGRRTSGRRVERLVLERLDRR